MALNVASLVVSVSVSAATAFFVGRASAREVAPADVGAAQLKESFRDVEKTLEDIRRSLAERPAPAAAAAASLESRAAPPPTARAVAPVVEDPPAGTRPAPPAGAAGPLLPPANLSRAKELHEWESSEDVRRRWFFVSEAEALAVFGTPQSIDGWESGERWEYADQDWNLSLRFLRGRLVNVFTTDKRR